MHEMSLAQGVIDIILDQAIAQKFDRVKRVVLEVGALSCVDPHALEFGFDAVANGTLAEGAELTIDTCPAKARCFDCETELNLTSRADTCPNCHSSKLLLTEGEELRLKELEVI